MSAGESVVQENNVEWFASLSVGELCRSLWQHRWSVMASTFGLSLLLALVVFLLPVKYDSDAQLLVRLGRNTLSSDPTSNVTPTVSVQETRLSQVNSVKEMLQSRALAEKIVDEIGPERILQPHGIVESTIQALLSLIPSSGGGGGGGGDEQSLTPEVAKAQIQKEEAIAKLQNNIVFTTARMPTRSIYVCVPVRRICRKIFCVP